jgi:hypothetical protein
MLRMHGALTPLSLMSSRFGASLCTGITTLLGLDLEEDAR